MKLGQAGMRRDVRQARLLPESVFNVADRTRDAREVPAIYEFVVAVCHEGHDMEAPAAGSTRILRGADRYRLAPRLRPARARRDRPERPAHPTNGASAIRYTSSPMQKQAWTWTTRRLPQPGRMARWGHFGTPVVIFPTAGGDFEEIERFQLIAALGELIDN